MQKNSKIYIAGHSGMVGSAIVRKFKSEGFTNLVLRTSRELNLLEQKSVGDFFESEKPEYVILAAAKVGGIKANMEYQADFLYENLQIQNNVIWAAHKTNVEKFLFLGSSCIYPVGSPQPMQEDHLLSGKLEPTNEGYSIAKIAGLKLCEKIFNQYGQTFISCMPTNIYGVGDNFDPESSHVIPGLMRRMHEAKENNLPEVVIWGSGSSRREFLYVDDLAESIYWLMENYEEVNFLNIGTGQDVSVKELAEMIKEVVGYRGELVFDTTKPDGMPRKLLDVSKMSGLGWRAEVELRDGIEKEYLEFKMKN